MGWDRVGTAMVSHSGTFLHGKGDKDSSGFIFSPCGVFHL